MVEEDRENKRSEVRGQMKKTRRTMHVGASPTTFVKAKYLRSNTTPAERLLWKFLSNKQMEGVKFRQQHPLDIYVIDFYSHELKLGIEVDGDYHNEKLQVFEDENRDLTLTSYGLSMIRYSNDDVLLNTTKVLEDIRARIIRLRELKGKI